MAPRSNPRSSSASFYAQQAEASEARLRIRVLTAVVSVLFLILLGRFWYLQIAEGDYYRQESENNRTANIELPAPRGIIRDRHGVLLASTRPAFSVSILPAEVGTEENLNQELAHLAPILGQSKEELTAAYQENRIGRFRPVTLARDVPMDVVTALAEEQPYLPGVNVESDPVRVYPQGMLASHLLGYVREVSAEELARLNDEEQRRKLEERLKTRVTHNEQVRIEQVDYRPRDVVGKTGVERVADLFLQGRVGKRQVARDARGNLLNIIGVVSPSPGHTVNLTLDARVQRAAEEGLKGKVGAAVALDPRNGDVLALASAPTFDPSCFAHRMSPQEYQQRFGPQQHKPLLNRAIGSAQPPGSTFKMVSATALLEQGTINTHSSTYCSGSLHIGNMTKRCWAVHNNVNIYDALAKSCDVFFYKFGIDLTPRSPDPIANWAEAFGLGHRTGIPLAGEAAGHIPRRREYKDWYPGDTANTMIGQGYILCTPLQVAQMLSVVANGGTIYQPRVVHNVTSVDGRELAAFPPTVTRKVTINPQVLQIVRQGLRQVVTDGTGRIVNLPQIAVAAKTGSAEHGRNKMAHAWFCCYAPFDNPSIAIAVLVEEGGHGASASGPVAKRMLQAYFGLPMDPVKEAPPPSTRGD